MMNDNKSEFV